MKRKFIAVLCLAVAMSMLTAGLAHAGETPTEVRTLAGTGSHGSDDGMEAQFNLPMGVGSSPSGEILVADTFNSLIRAIDGDGAVGSLNTHFPEFDSGGFPIGGRFDGEFEQAFFNRPTGFAQGLHGWVFVADSGNHTVRVLIGDRAFTMAGALGEGFADGARLEAMFSFPTAVAVCPEGNVYVADTGNHAIRRIDHEGNVTTVAGTAGVYGFQDGEAGTALFDSPKGLAFGDDGRLFIADTGNHLIRVLEDGIVNTFAGIWMRFEDEGSGEWSAYPEGGFFDGDVYGALFNRPMGLAYRDGLLFVADSGNHSIRAVVDGVEVVTVAGTGFPGNADGDLSDATFFLPGGVYVFGEMLLVADTGNNMIRSIDLTAFLNCEDC